MNFHLTPISMNVKTGPIPVTTSSAATCPDSCPFKANGCYASGGPLNIHWKKVTEGERGGSADDLNSQIAKFHKGQLYRLNQAGDLFGKNNWIDSKALKELVKANKNKKGFTYTHKPVLVEDIKNPNLTEREKWVIVRNNREAIKHANQNGFTINLSGNNLDHADKLKALEIGPVVSVIPSDQETTTTKGGNKAVLCPATTRDDVTCARCGLCQVQKRGAIVAFQAHGNAKRKVSEMATV